MNDGNRKLKQKIYDSGRSRIWIEHDGPDGREDIAETFQSKEYAEEIRRVTKNWFFPQQPAPTTPTVPGWYWVRLESGLTVCKEITEFGLENNLYEPPCMVNVKFSGPIPLPEGW